MGGLMIMSKECAKCKESKNLDEFSKNKKNKTGIENICKSCIKIKTKEYRASPEFRKRMEKLQKTNTKKGKICTMCGKYKKLDKFYHCSTNKDGYAWGCKRCLSTPKKPKPVLYIGKYIAKTCTKCGVIKRLKDFRKSTNGYLHRQGRCKQCKAKHKEIKQDLYIDGELAKKCTKCGNNKKINDGFYNKKGTSDGKTQRCKTCLHMIKTKEKQYINGELSKQCTKCNKWKVLAEFHVTTNGLYNRHSNCTVCINKYTREHRTSPEFRKRMKKLQKTSTKKGKTCTTCGKYRKLEKFHNVAISADGKGSTCKICTARPKKPKIILYIGRYRAKVCTKCKIKKVLRDFKKKKDGIHMKFPQCRTCENEQARKYHADSKNKNNLKKRQKIHQQNMTNKNKKCTKCGIYKKRNDKEFYVNNNKLSGLSPSCKKCDDKHSKEYYLKPKVKKHNSKRWKIYNARPEVIKHKKKIQTEKRIKSQTEDPLLHRANLWMSKMKKLPGTDVKQVNSNPFVKMQQKTPNCPICNIKLSYNTFNIINRSNTPSLDKLIPELGYIKTNVNIVCFECNSKKSNISLARLAKIINWMKQVKKLNTLNDIIDEFKGDGTSYKKLYAKASYIRKRSRKIDITNYLTTLRILNMMLKTKKCPICDIRFHHKDNSNYNLHRMSVDKFIPSKGYVKGNISIICKRCNLYKNNFTLDEIIRLYRWMKLMERRLTKNKRKN